MGEAGAKLGKERAAPHQKGSAQQKSFSLFTAYLREYGDKILKTYLPWIVSRKSLIYRYFSGGKIS